MVLLKGQPLVARLAAFSKYVVLPGSMRSDSDIFLMFYAFCNWDFTMPSSWLTHAAILMVRLTNSW
ncbi:hypothetical protein J1N35_004584, partial [Gossypium stocksii]